MFIDLTLPLGAEPQENANQRAAGLFRLGHHGTHLDRLLRSVIPIEYCRSRALLFDVSAFSRERPVEARDIPLEMVMPGDFVLFRTGAIQRNPYASRGYLEEYIEFSWELLNSLLAKKIRFIGLDARGLRQNEEHRKADTLCEEAGVFVIENLTNLQMLYAEREFVIYTAWFDGGGTGLPCKVVAEQEPSG